MCSNALQSDFHALMMLNSTLKHKKPQFSVGKTEVRSTIHRHVYTVAWFTLCYGWRVGIVETIFIVTATAAPLVTLPYLTLPYLTLPYLTLPYLTLPYLTLP